MVYVEGNYNEGACYGDIGGPLIDTYARYHTVHVGVSSFVSGNGCESTDPSGYTRTYPYVDWIQYNVFCIIPAIRPVLLEDMYHTVAKFPFSAAIEVETSTSKHFCGGTLYGNQWIITAGQCVDRAILFTISLGSASLDKEDSSRLTVASSCYVEFTDFIKPITALAMNPLPNYSYFELLDKNKLVIEILLCQVN
ncbi:hypothetical protein MTP99_009564 [Tenebrio molitor]|nr:hypothetical protein MTP99_009564 [Tenebrio molitor]